MAGKKLLLISTKLPSATRSWSGSTLKVTALRPPPPTLPRPAPPPQPRMCACTWTFVLMRWERACLCPLCVLYLLPASQNKPPLPPSSPSQFPSFLLSLTRTRSTRRSWERGSISWSGSLTSLPPATFCPHPPRLIPRQLVLSASKLRAAPLRQSAGREIAGALALIGHCSSVARFACSPLVLLSRHGRHGNAVLPMGVVALRHTHAFSHTHEGLKIEGWSELQRWMDIDSHIMMSLSKEQNKRGCDIWFCLLH